jgi:predicted nicotinamide N-methyase
VKLVRQTHIAGSSKTGDLEPWRARARAALLERIHRRYQTVARQWEIGPLRIPFVQVADPDRVLDQVAEEEDRLERLSGTRAASDQLHLPYWAELWDSAAGIGQHLASNFPGANRLSVLDLGCGMGLAGTVAARLGMRVLFADLEAPALLFARLNSLPDAGRVRTRRLNWQTDRLDERFDLILGADILYERRQWDFLEPFWRAHLAGGGTVLLGEPGRQTGDLFQDWIRAKGWSLEQHTEQVSTRPTPIRLFELRVLR